MSVEVHLHLHRVDELVPHLVHHPDAHLNLLAVEVSRLDGFGLTAGGVPLRDIVSRGLRLQPPELLELGGGGEEESPTRGQLPAPRIVSEVQIMPATGECAGSLRHTTDHR